MITNLIYEPVMSTQILTRGETRSHLASLPPPKTSFAFVRAHRVMKLGYLAQQEVHAKRLVPTAEPRPRLVKASCLSWSAYGSPAGEYIADFRQTKLEKGARERRGAALGLHLLLGISPGWIEAMGDLHDPFNPRVQALFRAAIGFAERHTNGTFAARMDLDERGGGVVDVFLTHVHERQARLRKNGTRGAPTSEISVRAALDEMSTMAGAQKSFIAIQTLWADWARRELHDSSIVRGVAKSVTGRRHLSVQEYRQSIEQHKEHEETREGSLKTIGTTARVWLEAMESQRRRGAEQDAEKEQLLELKARLEHERRLLEVEKAEVRAAAERQAEQYVDWAAEKYAYESGYNTMVSRAVTALADGEGRLEEARRIFEAEKADANASAKRQAAERERQYTDWAAEKYAYESGFNTMVSRSVTALADGEGRLEETQRLFEIKKADEQRSFEAAKADVNAAAAAREERVQIREEDVTAREKLISGLEAETERRADTLDERDFALTQAFEVAHRRVSDATQRAAEADRVVAQYDTIQRRLAAGLSLLADGRLQSVDDVDIWPEADPVRPLLANALKAVDTRTAAERRSLHEERQRQAERSGRLLESEAEVTSRGTALDAQEADLYARNDAYHRGLAKIAAGVIATRAEIDADRSLVPAANLVKAALDHLNSTSDHVRQRLASAETESARILADATAAAAEASVKGRAAEAAMTALTLLEKKVLADEARVAIDRATLDAHGAAWRTGVAAIETGRLRSADDIQGRHELVPAAADLVRAVRAIEARVVQRTRQAGFQIALAAEERSRLAEERAQARVAHQTAVEAVKKADGRVQEAEQVRTAANMSVKTANRVRSKMSGVLSSVSRLVEVAESRNDIPADLAPALRAVVEEHKALIEIEGRGRG